MLEWFFVKNVGVKLNIITPKVGVQCYVMMMWWYYVANACESTDNVISTWVIL